MSKYVIAKYIRSVKSGAENQRLILDSYIEKLGIPNVEILEFSDVGYGGADTERPAFQELLKLVRSGKINCVIANDFARFSRNAIDNNYFTKQFLPSNGVRLISVNDNYDSDINDAFMAVMLAQKERKNE